MRFCRQAQDIKSAASGKGISVIVYSFSRSGGFAFLILIY